MLKAIVIDDEPMALEVVKALSEKVVFVDVKGYYTNCFEAIQYIKSNPVDLIFLDIKMPDISGIELVKSIANPPMVIFTTAYSEHAVESFELNAIDYLLKPFSLARFLKACNKAYEQYQLRLNQQLLTAEPAYVFIKSGYDQIKINLDDIWYAEGNGNYIDFVLEKKKITSRLTMNEAEALLPAPGFIRVHRSYIISKKHITKASRKSIWIGTHEIPVGSAYADEADKIIK